MRYSNMKVMGNIGKNSFRVEVRLEPDWSRLIRK